MPLIQTDKPVYYIAEDGTWPITEQEIHLAHPNTSFPVVFVVPDGYNPVFPVPVPAFDTITQTVVEAAPALVGGKWKQQWEVMDLPQEQIDANIAAQAAAEQATINAKVEALWAAADRYVTGYISGVAIGILTIGVIQSKPKAIAVTGWSSAIWAEYYARKALVTIDSVDNLDYSTFGAMPYSVPELQAEIGL